MDLNKLLDIINCILTEKNIYELFRNHGYDESFENLQTDLANLLDKFIVTDNELNEVAGGRGNALTRISSGILASIASFSGMNFVGAQTLKEEQSKSQRVLNSIKETGVNSAKKAAKFAIKNGGKIAGVGTLSLTWSFLCALIGRYTKKVPVVETKDMTEDEKSLIGFAQEVLKKIYEDIRLGKKNYFDSEHNNYQNLKELIKDNEIIEGIPEISEEVTVGELVQALLPEPKETSTQAYRDGRDALIKNEKDNIDLTRNLIQRHINDKNVQLNKQIEELEQQIADKTRKLEEVEKENENLKTTKKTDENTDRTELEQIEKDKKALEEELASVSTEKTKLESELKVLNEKSVQQQKEIDDKNLKINNQEKEIKKLEEDVKKLENETQKDETDETQLKTLKNKYEKLESYVIESTENATLTNWNTCADVILCKVDPEKLRNKLHDWAGEIYDEETEEKDGFLKRANVLMNFWCDSGQTETTPSEILPNEEVKKVLTAEWGIYSWGAVPRNVTKETLTKFVLEARRWNQFFKSWNANLTNELLSASYLREFLAFLLVSKLVGNNGVVRGIFDGIAMYVGTNQKAKVVEKLKAGLEKCGLQLNKNSITDKTTGNVIRFFS